MLSKRLQNFVPAFTNCAHTIPDRTNQKRRKEIVETEVGLIYIYTCGLYVYVYNHQSTSGHLLGFILFKRENQKRKIDSNHS